eukprot:2789356-Rhodomonas_salina.1
MCEPEPEQPSHGDSRRLVCLRLLLTGYPGTSPLSSNSESARKIRALQPAAEAIMIMIRRQ